jgi:hypothetical protein
VPVAAARDVITALGRDQLNPHELLGAAHEAVAPHRRPDRDSDAWRDARQRAGAFVSARGWRVHPEATALDQLADVLAGANGSAGHRGARLSGRVRPRSCATCRPRGGQCGGS